MPDDVKALAEKTEEGIKSGEIVIFKGPLKAQDGTMKIADGQTLDDGAIAGMDWLAEGIEGQLPK
jgi:simple sugar transport system substrate-binding protein